MVSAQPELFLFPMKDWHLRSEFKDGKNVGGRIQYVWLFAWMGLFILVLACINFINLSTARSEKRAKEIGVRKTLGSVRQQLVIQFLVESILIVVLAFGLCLSLVQFSLPWFNEVADKQMTLPWSTPFFWGLALILILGTGLFAGIYPALYLSSFQPIKALKGTFQIGRWTSVPRKVLVVLQFCISIVLLMGTILVHQQIQLGQDRPLGYEQDHLITVSVDNGNLHRKSELLEQQLKKEGIISDMSLTTAPMTRVWSSNIIEWEGKDPNLGSIVPFTGIDPSFGQTIGWEIIEGRDFSTEQTQDLNGLIVNQAAVDFMGLEQALGTAVNYYNNQSKQIIGVVKNLLIESPFQEIRPHFYYLMDLNAEDESRPLAHLKLLPTISASQALRTIRA
ncbi:MAG: FtsX-like permease family protein, partial [Bacteroidota bacterium]